MLDEPPILEFAATAVAVVLTLRVVRLAGGAALDNRRARIDSARARDLIGMAIVAGAVVYALRVERASTWFLVASGVAVAAQLLGFYLRARSQPAAAAPGARALDEEGPELELDDEELMGCPQCGHGTLIELDDPSRLMAGLSGYTPVSAAVCPSCGALSGQVDDPAQIPIGDAHGTSLRHSPSGDDNEALEAPTEHDG